MAIVAFKPGDLVQLKSGGPIMTVGSANPNTTSEIYSVRAIWYDENSGSYQGQDFNSAMLKHVGDEDQQGQQQSDPTGGDPFMPKMP